MSESSKPRKHFAAQKLPQDLLETIEQLVLEGQTYTTIHQHIQGLGAEISRSALARYGQHLLRHKRDLEATGEMARELLQVAQEVPVEELAAKLALERIVHLLLTQEEVLPDDDLGLSIRELTSLCSAVARLQATAIARQRWERDLSERAHQAAQEVAKTAQRGGLSEATVEELRARVLGIAAMEEAPMAHEVKR